MKDFIIFYDFVPPERLGMARVNSRSTTMVLEQVTQCYAELAPLADLTISKNRQSLLVDCLISEAAEGLFKRWAILDSHGFFIYA